MGEKGTWEPLKIPPSQPLLSNQTHTQPLGLRILTNLRESSSEPQTLSHHHHHPRMEKGSGTQRDKGQLKGRPQSAASQAPRGLGWRREVFLGLT